MRNVTIAAATILAASLPAQVAGEAEKPAQERPYDLMVGDPAPPLAIQTWVKGEPVDAFAPGTTYVVEFWATWCSPCIMGMPHLSELQEKYADQGVRIIGVNIWDEPDNVQPFMEKDVPIHKKPGDEVMRYTVAIEKKHDPENIRNGEMAAQWMEAAGRNGIPTAFIVDQKARIAWIGHPSGMDDPLEQIVAGEWDLEQAARKYAVQIAGQAQVDKYYELFRAGEYEAAYELGRKIVRGPLSEHAMGLNSLAWGIVDPKSTPKQQDLDLALEAAERANELTKSADPYILDTLAAVHHQRGDLDNAVKWQKLAVEHATEKPSIQADIKADLDERLKEYEREAAAAEASAEKAGAGEKTEKKVKG